MVTVMTSGCDGTCPPLMVTAHFAEPVSGPALYGHQIVGAALVQDKFELCGLS